MSQRYDSQTIVLLNTSTGHNDQFDFDRFGQFLDKNAYIYVSIGTGDAVDIQCKVREEDPWVTIKSYTSSDVSPYKVAPYTRAVRTSGTSNDTLVVIKTLSTYY